MQLLLWSIWFWLLSFCFSLKCSENNTISVWNDGRGIPVEMHKEQKVYVPTLIFGHLLTSSNYNDDEKKVTGGRNGYGAKLCNIFSTKFVVETCSSDSGKKFKQVLSYIYNYSSRHYHIQVQVLLLNLCMAFNKTLYPRVHFRLLWILYYESLPTM